MCKKDFEAIEGLEIHLRTHLADEPSRCGLCHFTAQDREELRNHILSMHYQSLNVRMMKVNIVKGVPTSILKSI